MFRSFFKDRDGNYVIAQFPNLPIILWAAFIVARSLTEKPVSDVLNVLAYAALSVWAYLEITGGDSPFRRVIGVAVVLLMVMTFIK